MPPFKQIFLFYTNHAPFLESYISVFKIRILLERALGFLHQNRFINYKLFMLFNYIFAIVLCYNSEILIYLVGLKDFGLLYEVEN